MTRPCDRWCPFTGCDSCPWPGGSEVASSGLTCDNEATTETAPAGASTPVIRGLTTTSTARSL